MKTTVSVCTLCLLLCVVGSYAAAISGSVGSIQPGLLRTLNNVATNNAVYNKAVSDVTDALKYANDVLVDGYPTYRSANLLTSYTQLAFADFIDATLKSGNGPPPPKDCTSKQIDVDIVSIQFSQAVRQAFGAHEDYFIKVSSDCFSKAVFDVSLETVPWVNEGRCIYKDQFTTENHLLNYGFESKLDDSSENVILGMFERNEAKAMNCHYTPDDFDD